MSGTELRFCGRLYGAVLFLLVIWPASAILANASNSPPDPCPRPSPGGSVPEPEDLRSRGGVLKAALTLRNHLEADGSMRYCYLLADGTQSPTLRLRPGDLLILSLKNELTEFRGANTKSSHLRFITRVWHQFRSLFRR